MSYAGAVLTTDNWATGGKPSIRSNVFTDSGKPFQEGWDSVPGAGTKGSNKPTVPRNYRVVLPFNVMEYRSPGETFHKYLEHMVTFLVYDDTFMAKDRFEKMVLNGNPKAIQRGNLAAGPIVPVRNLPATNYSLAKYCVDQGASKVSIFDVLKKIAPLGIPHNPRQTTDAYPRGSHVHNHTLVGSVDMYNMFPTTAANRASVTEGDYLFLILKKVHFKKLKNNPYNFDFESPLDKRVVSASDTYNPDNGIWQIIPWSCANNYPSIEDLKNEDVKSGNVTYGAYVRLGFVEELVISEQVRDSSILRVSSSVETRKDVNYNSVADIMNAPIIRVKMDQNLVFTLV